MKHLLSLSIFLSLILLTPGCAEEELLTSNGAETSTATIGELNAANAAITEERGGAIVVATQRITPAVVTITTLTRVTERIYDPWSGPFFNDPFFREFFGSGGSSEPQYREREIPGMGSGFIISDDGYVLTAEHVVHSADEIEITLPDGRAFAGEVVGRDPYSDTAVVRIIDGTDLPVATLGDSDKLVVGEWAIAVGNPFGFVVRDPQPSVTVGVISATNRVTRQQISTGEARVFEGIIQTDAAINPGNSGGPLVNALGEVIGINSSILSTSGGSQGIGFAVPINLAREIAEELIASGGVSRSYIGFYLQDLTPSIAQAMHLSSTEGAIVSQVDAGSPADEVGLQVGDIVLSMQGEAVIGVDQFSGEFGNTAPGDEIVLTVLRDGRQYRVVVVVVNCSELETEAR